MLLTTLSTFLKIKKNETIDLSNNNNMENLARKRVFVVKFLSFFVGEKNKY